jgi:hypothetical protein
VVRLITIGVLLMDKVYELESGTAEELLENQISILNVLTDAVAEAINASPFDIEPDNYFIWMYSVEPFPEA